MKHSSDLLGVQVSKDIYLAILLFAIMIWLLVKGSPKSENDEVVVRHRHPDNIRRKRKEPVTSFFGIPIVVDPNVPTGSVLLVSEGNKQTILVKDIEDIVKE